MEKFENKLVYITGGSSGIGLDVARQLAQRGADIVLFARNRENLEKALHEIEKNKKRESQKIRCMSLDVQNDDNVRQVMKQAVGEFGIPDILINSAGVGHSDYFENITYGTFDAVIKTNLYGTRNVIASLLPHMKQKGGVIVITSSLAGLVGIYGYTAYGTSKFALVGFSESLRAELKPHGIRVCIVCPPEVDTPLVIHESKTIPPEARAVKNMGGLLKPEFVARRIIRGIQRKKYMIIPGFLANFMYYLQRFSPGWIFRLSSDFIAWWGVRKSAGG
jgi:NAD(P)-dependent dehydrogenase (short-subunit alcohol dehydrogenase family)